MRALQPDAVQAPDELHPAAGFHGQVWPRQASLINPDQRLRLRELRCWIVVVVAVEIDYECLETDHVGSKTLPACLVDHHVGVRALEPEVGTGQLQGQVVAPDRVVTVDSAVRMAPAGHPCEHTHAVPQVAVQPGQELRRRRRRFARQDVDILPARR